ncbi:hypothetical protein D3C73_1474890 [compost metagenome]
MQPNIPGASLGGFGGAEGAKLYSDRDSQFAGDGVNSFAAQEAATQKVGEEIRENTKNKTKIKKEAKISGAPSSKNTTSRVRNGSGSSSRKKRVASEATTKKITSGRRDLWIND